MSSTWPGSWKSSGSLLELSTVLLLVQGPLLLDSIRIYHAAARTCSRQLPLQSTILYVHYSHKLPDYFQIKLSLLGTDYSGNYAGILDASLELKTLPKSYMEDTFCLFLLSLSLFSTKIFQDCLEFMLHVRIRRISGKEMEKACENLSCE